MPVYEYQAEHYHNCVEYRDDVIHCNFKPWRLAIGRWKQGEKVGAENRERLINKVHAQSFKTAACCILNKSAERPSCISDASRLGPNLGHEGRRGQLGDSRHPTVKLIHRHKLRHFPLEVTLVTIIIEGAHCLHACIFTIVTTYRISVTWVSISGLN